MAPLFFIIRAVTLRFSQTHLRVSVCGVLGIAGLVDALEVNRLPIQFPRPRCTVSNENDFFPVLGRDVPLVVPKHDVYPRHFLIHGFIELAKNLNRLLKGSGTAAPAIGILRGVRGSPCVCRDCRALEVLFHANQSGFEGPSTSNCLIQGQIPLDLDIFQMDGPEALLICQPDMVHGEGSIPMMWQQTASKAIELFPNAVSFKS